ncbi:MAG: hypothetical protein HND39_13750 [Ignavibacteriota bacterium]|nr:MAG: hypothetical protein EDM72_10565 [Chlorobiota bacterium]MBE7478197.1 hypothetical protein [Ignavibacteriales bacterium]MBL1121573.1 hypothetical protein [Ignavibacteriota bacterium]MCC7093615.1 hypothetical protein [Ignavibacteriaceae bacterium]MCE7855245.1 hypothetical protein [Ignavibacteria bacterium CHB3]MEB2296094.1 hypothetical protein [Ignavibacteria bacterium]
MQAILNFFSKTVAVFLVLAITMLSSETWAQSNLRIFDVPGGGNNGTNQTDEGSNNSTIYIVGGLVIAGILAYALFFKEKKADTDTTASLSSPSDYSNISRFDSFEEEFQTAKEEIPVDIFLGVNNDKAILNNKIYQLGLRVKF